jgi:hypothetical protein
MFVVYFNNENKFAVLAIEQGINRVILSAEFNLPKYMSRVDYLLVLQKSLAADDITIVINDGDANDAENFMRHNVNGLSIHINDLTHLIFKNGGFFRLGFRAKEVWPEIKLEKSQSLSLLAAAALEYRKNGKKNFKFNGINRHPVLNPFNYLVEA